MSTPAHDCRRVQETLWRYVDRELSARQMAEVSRELRRCEDCQRAHDALSKQTRLLRAAFVDSPCGEGFVTRFRTRFEDEGLQDLYPVYDETVFFEELRDPRAARRRRFLAVAAMIVLIPAIVGLGLLINHERRASIGVVIAQGPVVVEANGSESALSLGQTADFAPGATYRVPEGAQLQLLLGTRVPGGATAATFRLAGPAEFTVKDGATVGYFDAFLQSGELQASVSDEAPREHFAIHTPHATAAVTGTEFDLMVGDSATSLVVSKGSVRASKGQRSEDVTPETGRVWIGPRGQFAFSDADPFVETATVASEADASASGETTSGDAASGNAASGDAGAAQASPTGVKTGVKTGTPLDLDPPDGLDGPTHGRGRAEDDVPESFGHDPLGEDSADDG